MLPQASEFSQLKKFCEKYYTKVLLTLYFTEMEVKKLLLSPGL